MLEKGGFGGVKMTGTPLPHCPFAVEQAYNGEGESYDCVNRRFFDCTDEGPRACAPSTSATRSELSVDTNPCNDDTDSCNIRRRE